MSYCDDDDLDGCFYIDGYQVSSYVWSPLCDQWVCCKCDMGLHRIYDPRNTLMGWIK